MIEASEKVVISKALEVELVWFSGMIWAIFVACVAGAWK